LSNKP